MPDRIHETRRMSDGHFHCHCGFLGTLVMAIAHVVANQFEVRRSA